MSEKETIEVHHKKSEEEESIEMLTWPQNYENFIKDIIAKFKLNKNTKIELQLITNDDDDPYINSQDDLNPYLEADCVGIKHFNVFFEGSTDPIDDDDNKDKVEPLQDIKIEEINIDEFMKDVFNSDDYKQNLKSDNEKLKQNFKNNLEKSFNDILVEKKNNINQSIELELSQYLKASKDDIASVKNSVLDFNDEIKELKENCERMSSAISDLKESIISKEVVLSKADVLKQHLKSGGDNIPEKKTKKLEMSGVENPNPLGDIGEDDNNNDNNNKILKIKFEQNNLEKSIEMKDAKFININDIKIKNVGNISAHKLFFIKNKEKSSNDFCFFGNSKETDEYELSMPGELKPNELLNCNISMMINNAQPGQEYNITLNATENKEIISEPFEIIIKINKPKEDPIEQKQIQANQIYEEIKNQFLEHEDLVNKNEIINKLIQNDLNKDAIINEINNAIKEKEQKEINSKAEKVYNELNMDNVNLDKNEVLNYIKEKQFNKEEVQKWIDEKKPKQEKANPVNDKFEEEVNKIYQELEDDYAISGFIEEEAAKDEIRRLNLDREAINKWIENTLIN